MLVQMDESSSFELHQDKLEFWDRRLHAELLNKLTGDGCDLVVFDVWFRAPHEQDSDNALASALKRSGRVVLMSSVIETQHHPDTAQLTTEGVQEIPPDPLFLNAASSNSWGIGKLSGKINSVSTPALAGIPSPVPGYQKSRMDCRAN